MTLRAFVGRLAVAAFFETAWWGVGVAFCTACVLVTASAAAGQTAGASTGAIDGNVTESSGGALAGVTIAASGPALMGVRTAVSDAAGFYRIPALPPGVYVVGFERGDFLPAIRNDVHVSLDRTTTVLAALVAATLSQAITVQADARVLDQHETSVATVFDREELAQLPGSRNLVTIFSATPAVQFTHFDVGGSGALTPPFFGSHGTSGYNGPKLEGIVVTRLFAFGVSIDYGALQEVSVGTAAAGPEQPLPHVAAQFLIKSGGNEYHGALYAGHENAAWQASNIDDDQVRRGAAGSEGLAPREANRQQGFHDTNADVGGFVQRDRAWWYGSIRDQAWSSREVAFPAEELRTDVTTITGKGTFRVGDYNRVVLFGHYSDNRQPIRLDGFLRGPTALNESTASTSSRRAEGVVWKAEWTSTVSENVFLEARAGQFLAYRAETPNGASLRFEDVADPLVRGGNRDWRTDFRRSQLFGSLSHFRRGPFGEHQLRVGGSVLRTMASETWYAAYPGDVLHVTQRGIPRQVYLFEAPSRSEYGDWWYSAYIDDSWQPHARLTLNLGLRYDRYRVFLPDQSHPAGRFNPAAMRFAAVDNLFNANALSPRLGASHDLTADGETILKASYALYWLPQGARLGFNANPNSPTWWTLYPWSDANMNGSWDSGEEGIALAQRGGAAAESLDPELKLGYMHEVTARLERELFGDMSIETGFVWRGERRPSSRLNAAWPREAFTLEKVLPDPGPDGLFDTADDGPDLLVHDLPRDLIGVFDNTFRNLPDAAADHLTWEVTARQRFTRGWSLLGSFAHTWSHDQDRGYLDQPVRANAYPLTPNDLINTDPEGRHVFTMWSARLLGTYDGPWGVRIASLLRHQSGQPFGRTLVAQLNYGAIRVLAEPVGTRRQDNITILDLRVEKRFTFGGGRRAGVSIDVFNLLNANTEQNVNWLSGESFLRPLSIIPPRIARLAATLEW